MGEPTVPEQVYREAARANVRTLFVNDQRWSSTTISADTEKVLERTAVDHAQLPSFRAAVESAYRAGRQEVMALVGREAQYIDQCGGMISAAWVAMSLEHIARSGSRWPGRDDADG